MHVGDDVIDAMDDYMHAFHGEPELKAWEVDPLETDAERAQRTALVAASNPQSLVEEYVAMREATKIVLGM